MKRQFKTDKASAADLAAAQMPELHHTLPGQPFDIGKSEVVAWLIKQPAILQHVFSRYHDHGAIAFDPAKNTWKGIKS